MTASINFTSGTVVTTDWANAVDANVFDYIANVRDYGATGDGTTDDTAAIQLAINSGLKDIYFPSGTYKITSSLSISGKTGITLRGTRSSKLLFTDGSYDGLSLTSASYRCTIRDLQFYGTETTSPLITLIKVTGDSAYTRIENCEFAYASKALAIGKTYVNRVMNNSYSNCDRYVYAYIADGSNTDLALIGDTYGTSTIGTNPCVDIQYIDTRLIGCYFETVSRVKDSLRIQTATQFAVISGCHFDVSGRVSLATSNQVTFSGNSFKNVYDSSTKVTLRVEGGGRTICSGNIFSLDSVVASSYGVSASGEVTFTGNLILGYTTGFSTSGAGIVTGNSFVNNTTAISLGNPSTTTVGSNEFTSNTTNISNTTSTAKAPGHFTGTLTGGTTSPTGTCYYSIINDLVTIEIPNISATSNSTAMTLTGIPTPIQASVSNAAACINLVDNGSDVVGTVSASGGTLTFLKGGSTSGFTASGTKGIRNCSISYRLNNV